MNNNLSFQIESELHRFVCDEYTLPHDSFRLAVCGIRGIKSEHEDELCVALEPLSLQAKSHFCAKNDIEKERLCSVFFSKAIAKVSKGAKPDRFLVVPSIPVVESKGVVSVPDLRKLFLNEIR